jgi:hypothetical protein
MNFAGSYKETVDSVYYSRSADMNMIFIVGDDERRLEWLKAHPDAILLQGGKGGEDVGSSKEARTEV